MRLPLLLLLLLAACAPETRPAGPPVRIAAIENPFRAPPLPWAPHPAYALAPAPPRPLPSGPAPEAAFVAADGARLPLRAWHPAGEPRFLLLALHGFGDHGGNFLADAGPLLAAGGALVVAPDQRGFGWTAHRGVWAGADALVADARALAALLAARHPGLPLFVLGESMGASVVLLADPPEAHGRILLAPAIWARRDMPALLRGVLVAVARLAPALAAAPVAGGIVPSDNPEALRRLGTDPLVLRTIRADLAKGLVDLMDAAVAALPGPPRTLVMLGARDAVVPPAITHRALSRAGAPRVARYPEGWHLLLRDRVRTRVAADILRFMADPDSPLPAEAEGRRWLTVPAP